MMEIKNDVNLVLISNPRYGYLAYIEQLPEISAYGQTLAEAKDNVISELERYERDHYTLYRIMEYKYKVASFS